MIRIGSCLFLSLVCVLPTWATTTEDDSYYSRVRPIDDVAGNEALDALEGKAPPPFVAESWANTKALDWEKLRGKIVILDFWGVWCAPCKEALPKLHKLYEKHHEDGLVIVGVHTQEARDLGKKFVAEGNVKYPVVFDSKNKTAEAYHVKSYPSYYIIDHRGVLRFAHIYSYELAPVVEKLVGERKRDQDENTNSESEE